MKIVKKMIENIRNKNSADKKGGVVFGNTVRGLSIGVFAIFVIYSVYSAYNNSPAYNPAKRAIFAGEGMNLSVNSFENNILNFQDEDSTNNFGSYSGGILPSSEGGFTSQSAIQNRMLKEQEGFDAARSYFDAQKAEAAQAASQKNTAMIASQNGMRSSFEAVDGGDDEVLANKKSRAKNRPNRNTTKTTINEFSGSGSMRGGMFGGSASSGSSANISGAGSSSYGGSGRSSQDNSSRALPQNQVTGKASSEAFKFGRGGNVGGYNVAAAGGAVDTGKGGRGGDAKAQLNIAYRQSGKATMQIAGGKNLESGVASANAAFDGNIVTGSTIDGENVVDAGGIGLGLDHSGLSSGLKNLKEDWEDHATKKKRLQGAVTNHLIKAFLATLAAMIAIMAFVKTKNVYAYIGAAAITAAALYSIWAMDYDGDGMSIHKTLSELMNLRAEDGQSNNSWLYYGAFTLMTGGLALAWYGGMKEWNLFKGKFMERVQDRLINAAEANALSAASDAVGFDVSNIEGEITSQIVDEAKK